MAYSYVIVVDQGTHSTRAIIYNTSGEAVFKSQQEVDLFYRDSLHIEQDGSQILASCKTVLANAHDYVKKNKLQQVAVALTTQRSTVLAWDANTGDVITPALSWLDTRAQDELKNILMDEAEIKEKTGLPLSPHYGASKLQWLLQHDVSVQRAQQQKRLKFGPLAAYLIFNLVEQQSSYVDYSNAHRTLLWNLQTREWDADLLTAFFIDAAHLPKPVPNAFEYGNIKQYNYPLVLVNGDQNSAVYGYGELNRNTSFVNMGTGAFVLANSHQQPVLNTKLLASITYSADGSDQGQEYALEGTVNGAGAAMTWAESEWNINDIESIDWKEVEDVPIFLNTVGGLGSPFWQSDIAPTFLNAKNDYSNEQRMAALMESVVFLIAINIEEMRKHNVETDQMLVAGGMSKDDHLCQCLADICSAVVTVSSFKEATSRGAAWLALQKPNWDVLENKEFNPINNKKLQSRFDKFKKEIVRVMH